MYTNALSFNSGFTNLLRRLVEGGYTGDALLIYDGSCLLFDDDANPPFYLHVAPSDQSPLASGASGVPIGGNTGAASVFVLPKGTDLSNVWIFNPSSARNLVVSIVNAGGGAYVFDN
jgi:hypothetical protein